MRATAGEACYDKIILADSQAIFRAGTAKVLAMDEDFRIIAQCADLERMLHAIAVFGAIVLFAKSLRPELGRLRLLLDGGSRAIVIAEIRAPAATCTAFAVVFRNVGGTSLVECVRRVAVGDKVPLRRGRTEEDMVGTRATVSRPRKCASSPPCRVAKPRDCPAPQNHRAGDQELPALNLRQDRRQRSPGTRPVHHSPPRSGPGRRGWAMAEAEEQAQATPIAVA